MSALFFGRHRNPIEEKQKSALLTSEQVQEMEPIFLSIVSAYRYKLLRPGEQISMYLNSENANYITGDVRFLATSVPAHKMLGFVVDRYVAARLQGYHPSDISNEGKSIDTMIETAEKDRKDPRSAILSVLLGDPVSRPIEAEIVLHKYILHLVNEVIRFYRLTKRISDGVLIDIPIDVINVMSIKAGPRYNGDLDKDLSDKAGFLIPNGKSKFTDKLSWTYCDDCEYKKPRRIEV